MKLTISSVRFVALLVFAALAFGTMAHASEVTGQLSTGGSTSGTVDGTQSSGTIEGSVTGGSAGGSRSGGGRRDTTDTESVLGATVAQTNTTSFSEPTTARLTDGTNTVGTTEVVMSGDEGVAIQDSTGGIVAGASTDIASSSMMWFWLIPIIALAALGGFFLLGPYRQKKRNVANQD